MKGDEAFIDCIINKLELEINKIATSKPWNRVENLSISVVIRQSDETGINVRLDIEAYGTRDIVPRYNELIDALLQHIDEEMEVILGDCRRHMEYNKGG